MKNLPNSPLVFLPGFGFHASIWQSTIDLISPHDYLLLDLPIVTEKIISSLHPFDLIVDELHQKIPKNATLIAWSLGGLIALYLVHRYPNDYRQLILVNSTPRFLADDHHHWPGISEELKQKFIKNSQHNYNKLMKYFIKLILYPHTEPTHQYFLKAHLWQDAHSLFSIFYLNLLFQYDLRDIFQSLRLPCASLLSEEDTIVNYKTMAALKKLNPQHPVQSIRHGSHASFISHPNDFVKKINEIINE